jgi:hypothetical protein
MELHAEFCSYPVVPALILESRSNCKLHGTPLIIFLLWLRYLLGDEMRNMSKLSLVTEVHLARVCTETQSL